MHAGRFVFSELIAHLPHKEFHKCVIRYHDGSKPGKFSYWDPYLAMTFAQLTYRESLRDVEACLGSVTGKLFHLGFRGNVARSTLADANETRAPGSGQEPLSGPSGPRSSPPFHPKQECL